MRAVVEVMLNRLSKGGHDELISWAAPVPSFGNLSRSPVASLGINPSNREFVDERGEELTDVNRRFHTLRSLDIEEWDEAGEDEIDRIVESCNEYFFRNPYNGWFKRLDPIVASTGHSYYDRLFPACHLDLLPFATDSKWGELSAGRRRNILKDNADLLVALIRDSSLKLLILNGQSVVTAFEAAAGLSLESKEMPSWRLPRSGGADVPGIAYFGVCDEIDGKSLKRPIQVLGFNHNIQSSFGVTSDVVRNISKWIGTQTKNHVAAR